VLSNTLSHHLRNIADEDALPRRHVDWHLLAANSEPLNHLQAFT